MGFRADFYIGRGARALWLGSLREHGTPKDLRRTLSQCSDVREFYARVHELVFSIPDGVARDQGWPWGYADSCQTDYAYALDGDQLWVSCYGSPWVAFADIDCSSILDDYDFDEASGPAPMFPDMRTAGLACV